VSQSLLNHAFGVRAGYDYVRTFYENGGIQFLLVVRGELLVCSRCGSRQVSRKGRRFRELQTVPIGFKQVWLVTEVPQCQRLACGQRFEVFPPLPRRTPRIRTGSKPSLRASGE
jgi:transposase